MSAAAAFGRDRRLRLHAEFQRAEKNARRVSTRHFVLLVAAHVDASRVPVAVPARLGLIVSRRVGNAVRRNRVKRCCRECFRTCADLLPPGIDLIVIARSGAADLTQAEVRGEWLEASRALVRIAKDVLARAKDPHHPPSHPPRKHDPDRPPSPERRPSSEGRGPPTKA